MITQYSHLKPLSFTVFTCSIATYNAEINAKTFITPTHNDSDNISEHPGGSNIHSYLHSELLSADVTVYWA